MHETLKMFEKSPSEYGLMNRDLEARRKVYRENEKERSTLKKMYEANLAKKVPNTLAAQNADNMAKVRGEIASSTMSTTTKKSL